MKIFLFVAASLLTTPVLAADPNSAPTVVSVAGEEGSQGICHVWPQGGDEAVRFLESGRESFSVSGLRKLSCEIKGSSRGPVTITINSPTLACPFKEGTADTCVTTLKKGSAISFEAKPKKG